MCWNTEAEPTISDYKTSEMAGVSEFSSSLRGLLRGTKYYVRAYATNDAGTSYGEQVEFTTSQQTQTITFTPFSKYRDISSLAI